MLRRTHSTISTGFNPSAEAGERKEGRRTSEEVTEKHLAIDKSDRETVLSLLFALHPASLCFSSPPSGRSRTVPRNCPGLLSSVLHLMCNAEHTLMCDFPSTCRPKWIGTSAIIFCHYSFQARLCAEIQTILAARGKKRGEREKDFCDSSEERRVGPCRNL